MSNLNADITDLVRPYAGSHAVERVTLGIEWKGELTSQVMQRLSDLLDDSEHPFPRKLEIHAKELAGSRDTPLNMPTQDEIDLVGLVLKSSSSDEEGDDAPVNELAIRQEGVFITIAKDYEGWKETKALVLPLVELILLELAEEITVSAVGLQYVDSFWLLDDLDFGRVFDRDNENLPPRAFKNDNYWHIEVGFFNSEEKDLKALLTSLQISYSPPEDEGSCEKITASCLTRTFFSSSEDLKPVAALAFYDSLHKKNKSTVRDLLSSELGEFIGLGAKSEALS